jgi:hypothetical protein
MKTNATKTEVAGTWKGWIRTYDAETGLAGGTSSVRGDTFEELITDIHYTGIYYQACGYKCKVEGLERRCRRCDGSGKIKSEQKGRATRKRCPDCKGVGILDRMSDIELLPPASVKMKLA